LPRSAGEREAERRGVVRGASAHYLVQAAGEEERIETAMARGRRGARVSRHYAGRGSQNAGELPAQRGQRNLS
jgi:hypothetical protein